ncbi:MAG: sialidase family protein [Myxococcales bacterium]
MRGAPLLLAIACACAGSGKRYPCDPAVADCGQVESPDGGPDQTPFISEPFLVFHDGAHNAGTDALPFAGALFAAFRHATAWSGDANAQVYVMRSDDKGRTWTQAGTLGVPNRDPRQPKLFALAGKLWLIATFWDTADPTAHKTTLRVSSSDDGLIWTPFATLPNRDGLAAWRPRMFGNQLFFSVWDADELFPPAAPTAFSLLSTADTVLYASAAPAPVGAGAREGELIVRASGEHWLAAPERTVGSSLARQTFCHAPSGVLDWSCWSVPGLPIESPALFEWKGILYVAGKRDTGNGYQRTSIWQVMEDDQDLSPVEDVPASFGDTGGPAVVQLDEDRALLTFHTTSKLDPRVAALGHEPTLVEAQAQDYASDILAVELFMPSAAAGH